MSWLLQANNHLYHMWRDSGNWQHKHCDYPLVQLATRACQSMKYNAWRHTTFSPLTPTHLSSCDRKNVTADIMIWRAKNLQYKRSPLALVAGSGDARPLYPVHLTRFRAGPFLMFFFGPILGSFQHQNAPAVISGATRFMFPLVGWFLSVALNQVSLTVVNDAVSTALTNLWTSWIGIWYPVYSQDASRELVVNLMVRFTLSGVVHLASFHLGLNHPDPFGKSCTAWSGSAIPGEYECILFHNLQIVSVPRADDVPQTWQKINK